MKNKKQIIKIIDILLFIIYIAFLLYLTLFKNYLGRTTGDYDINLIPFKNIITIFKEFILGSLSLRFFIRNIFGNLIAFTPFAYFLYKLFNIKNTKTFILTMTLIISFIEIMQFILQIGYCDIDDLILNLLGSYIIFNLIKKMYNKYQVNI